MSPDIENWIIQHAPALKQIVVLNYEAVQHLMQQDVYIGYYEAALVGAIKKGLEESLPISAEELCDVTPAYVKRLLGAGFMREL